MKIDIPAGKAPAFAPINDQLAQRLAKESWQRDSLPPEGQAVQLKAKDHISTFDLPFLCEATEAGWVNAKTREPLQADVVAWRVPERRQKPRTYVGFPNAR